MNDLDNVLGQALKQDIDGAFASLTFHEGLKANVRKQVASLSVLPPLPAPKPVWKRWQTYGWSTLAAAAVTGLVLVSSYHTGRIPGEAASSAPQAAAAPTPPMAGTAAPDNTPRVPSSDNSTSNLPQLSSSPPPVTSDTPTAQSDAPAPPSGDGTKVQTASGPLKPGAVPHQTTSLGEPVNVQILPTATTVTAGQPMTFTVRISATGEGGVSLGAAPKLTVRSQGLKNQTVWSATLADLAGKQLLKGAEVTAQVTWPDTGSPGTYKVYLEGLSVGTGQGSTTLNPGGPSVLVRYADGQALVRNQSFSLATTAQDVTVSLQQLEATSEQVRVWLRLDGVPGVVNNLDLALNADGQELTMISFSQKEIQGQGGVVVTAVFNPLSASTHRLELTAANLKVPGQRGPSGPSTTSVAGPWKVTAQLNP